MAAKFLGQFLLEQGLISAAQLLAALDAQRASNPMLGALAQARGWLDAKQAAQINDRQKREDKRFGDIAQDMGLLTASQVDALIAEQQAGRKLFGAILVEQGVLDDATLGAALKAHAAEREDATRDLELGVQGHANERALRTALASCVKLFPRILHTQCQPGGLLRDAAEAGDCNQAVLVRVDSEPPVSVSLACSVDTMRTLAGGFLSMDAAAIDDALARDAFGEMVNVLMGYVVKDVLAEGARYRASPPDFGTPVARWFDAPDRTLVVTLATQHGPVLLGVGA